MYTSVLIALLFLEPAVALDAAAQPHLSRGLVACCDQVSKPAPTSVERRRQLAHTLLDAGDALGAAAELGVIAAERPDDSRAWLDYSIALADESRFQDAAVAIAHTLLLDPQSFEANKVAVIAFENTGRVGEALQADLRLAAMGDRIAMKEIAEALLDGRATARNPNEAVQWLERAAAAGHIGAIDQLAQIYRDGLYGFTPDPVLATYWSKRAQDPD